jgi:glycosyltransferase involved in cell wall biosynthesis
MNPLLSIVIPTKDRYSTLFPVLNALLKYIDGSDYEIVVQDNSPDNIIAQNSIHDINDSRIKYYYSSLLLSVSDNSSLAISNCSGEYVIFIGDDDLVSPYILRIVEMMRRENLDCLTYNRGNYFWSDLSFAKEYAFNYPSSLQYSKHLSFTPDILYSEIELQKVLDKGGIFIYNLPCLYHGIVKKSIMDTVKEEFGSYVPGSSPDMAIASALAFVLKKYYYINYPVSISGASKKSAAGLSVNNSHIAKIEDVKWLPKKIVDGWDSKIPKVWTNSSITAQTMSEILTLINSDRKINYTQLYLNMIIYNPSIISIIKPLLRNDSKNYLSYKVVLLFSYLKLTLKRLLWDLPSIFLNFLILLRGDYKTKVLIKNINDVDSCMNYLSENTKI